MNYRNVNNNTIIPQRINARHYQIQSFTNAQKIYDIIYDYEKKRWICNCPDTTRNRNPRCKHCTLLVTWIAAQEQQLAQRQATEIAAKLEPSPLETALAEALKRIESLENQVEQLQNNLHKEEAKSYTKCF